jgi:hypothetical protein
VKKPIRQQYFLYVKRILQEDKDVAKSMINQKLQRSKLVAIHAKFCSGLKIESFLK